MFEKDRLFAGEWNGFEKAVRALVHGPLAGADADAETPQCSYCGVPARDGNIEHMQACPVYVVRQAACAGGWGIPIPVKLYPYRARKNGMQPIQLTICGDGLHQVRAEARGGWLRTEMELILDDWFVDYGPVITRREAVGNGEFVGLVYTFREEVALFYEMPALA
ncbi:MAG: hypothetical protein WC683_10260 [bacterium]